VRVSSDLCQCSCGESEFVKKLDSPHLFLSASPRGVISSKNGYNVDEKVRIKK
jgi:hypothetical protein